MSVSYKYTFSARQYKDYQNKEFYSTGSRIPITWDTDKLLKSNYLVCVIHLRHFASKLSCRQPNFMSWLQNSLPTHPHHHHHPHQVEGPLHETFLTVTNGTACFFVFSLVIEGTTEKVLQFIMPFKSIYNRNFDFIEQKMYFWTIQSFKQEKLY